MELSQDTIKTYGADRLSAATGLSRRTIYRWAAEGIPGEGTVRQVRESVIAAALQKISSPVKVAPKKRRAA